MDKMEEAREAIHTAFKITCRKCGSDNVVIDFEPPLYGSEWTGCYHDGGITLGCNDCGQNDVFVDLGIT